MSDAYKELDQLSAEYVDMKRTSLRFLRNQRRKMREEDVEKPKAGPSSGGLRITLPLPSFPSEAPAAPSSAPYRSSEAFPLMQLPDTVMDQLLGYFSFDEVSCLRRVNLRLNAAASSRLNRGFRGVERYHARLMREFKSKLPRRESERRSHPLIKHCDILTAIETRISLLGMTFMKYVDAEMCCFIPGKVIDEIYRVLARIKLDKNPPKAYEMLQELRDISSMAMEFFDERIVPGLKPNPNNVLSQLHTSTKYVALNSFGMTSMSLASPSSTPLSASTSAPSSPATAPVGYAFEQHTLRRVKTLERRQKKGQDEVKKSIREFKQTVSDQNVKISNLELVISSQRALITSQAEALKATEAKVEELSRRLSENEEKTLGAAAAPSRKRKKEAEEGGDSSVVAPSSSAAAKKSRTQRMKGDDLKMTLMKVYD